MEKNWIAVVGSPRKGKNTALIVDYIIEGLKEKEISVDKYILDSQNIATCSGCEGCLKTGICVINDDISKIIDHMKKADGYIVASPSHNYNVTAQMKALLDRTFCLNDYNNGWESRLSCDKKAIIVGVCAGEGNAAMGFTTEGMSRCLSELGVRIIDVIEYYGTKNMPVANNSLIKEHILEKIRNNKDLQSY